MVRHTQCTEPARAGHKASRRLHDAIECKRSCVTGNIFHSISLRASMTGGPSIRTESEQRRCPHNDRTIHTAMCGHLVAPMLALLTGRQAAWLSAALQTGSWAACICSRPLLSLRRPTLILSQCSECRTQRLVSSHWPAREVVACKLGSAKASATGTWPSSALIKKMIHRATTEIATNWCRKTEAACEQ